VFWRRRPEPEPELPPPSIEHVVATDFPNVVAWKAHVLSGLEIPDEHKAVFDQLVELFFNDWRGRAMNAEVRLPQPNEQGSSRCPRLINI